MASLPILASLFFGLTTAATPGEAAPDLAAGTTSMNSVPCDLSGVALARRGTRVQSMRKIRPASRRSVTRRGGGPAKRRGIRIRGFRNRRSFRPRSFLRNRARFRFRLRGEGPLLPAGMADIFA